MARKKKEAAQTQAPPVEAKPDQAPAAEPVTHAKIAKQEYVLLPIDRARVHPANPKKGNTDAIGESIEKNDFYGAMIVQKSTGFILVGNHRYKSALEKGLTEIPAIVVDVDDATATRIMLADNRIADLGTYDESVLRMHVEERARAGDLAGTGYGEADLERMRAKTKPPEAFPEFDGHVTTTYLCPSCGFRW